MQADDLEVGVKFVLDNTQTIVGSEGGSLELMDLHDGRLLVRYKPGHNEECPECVPNHEMVRQIMQTSLSVYAPHIREVELI